MQRNPQNTNDKKGNILSIFVYVLISLLIAFSIVRVVLSMCYFKVYVVGASMSSTLTGASTVNSEGGEYVYAYRSTHPRRGDIVIVETDHKTIIKRVIGLGGDTVELKDGVLYLNGEIKEEPYIEPENNTPEYNNFSKITVPKGTMFCLGDNRNVSVDSRYEEYGCMPLEWTAGIVADWSMSCKGAITAFNTFFDFTLPNAFRN